MTDPQQSGSEPLMTRGETAPVPSMPLAQARTDVDCWNSIGVNGDGSCSELAKFVHCRNCGVYSAAGALLLDREAPPGYQRDRTEHYSLQKKRITPGRLSVVIFRIGREWLAFPTHSFQDVVERRTVHSVPHRRGGIVLGVVNIRGQLLVCAALGRLLGIEQESRPDRPRGYFERLIVMEWKKGLITFPVDEVYGVHRYHREELEAPPATVSHSNRNFTRGLLRWPGRSVACLDEEEVFTALARSLM